MAPNLDPDQAIGNDSLHTTGEMLNYSGHSSVKYLTIIYKNHFGNKIPQSYKLIRRLQKKGGGLIQVLERKL